MKRRNLLQSLPAAVLIPAPLLAALAGKADGPMAATVVYELRVYHCNPGKLPDLLTRFREHTTKLFEKHGIKNIAYWVPADEPSKNDTLIYVIQHPSREAAAENWKAFSDDPDWKAVKEKSEAAGPIVNKIDSTYMILADFSPTLR